MSWFAILGIGLGSFAFKAAGMFGLGRLVADGWGRALGMLLPPALLSALVVSQTVSTGSNLVIDARIVGVVAGGLAARKGAPFWLVAVIAAVVTAGLRALT